MRKIEKQMIQAIKERKAFSLDNTSVSNPQQNDWQMILLHGNYIAAARFGVVGLETQVNNATFRVWPTRTTASRLRALGIDARLIKGKAAINGRLI